MQSTNAWTSAACVHSMHTAYLQMTPHSTHQACCHPSSTGRDHVARMLSRVRERTQRDSMRSRRCARAREQPARACIRGGCHAPRTEAFGAGGRRERRGAKRGNVPEASAETEAAASLLDTLDSSTPSRMPTGVALAKKPMTVQNLRALACGHKSMHACVHSQRPASPHAAAAHAPLGTSVSS